MAKQTDSAFVDYLTDLRAALIGDYNAKNFSASGKWARNAKVNTQSLQLELEGYTKFIIDNRQDASFAGRGPGGKMPPVDDIEDWIQDKGIQTDDPEGMAWGIAVNQQKFGNSVFRGRQGIELDRITGNVLDDHMDNIADGIFEDVIKISGI